jgi:hypothetical protein
VVNGPPPRQLIPLLFIILANATATANAEEAPRWLKIPEAMPGDEELIFTPRGFNRPGVPAIASGKETARLRVTVRDEATGQPTFCRVNVVGADGNYHEALENPLRDFSFTGTWPKQLRGNRIGKAPIRYFGRFFYTNGEFTVTVPAGPVQIEVWKGFEHTPIRHELTPAARSESSVELTLRRAVDMAKAGWYGGDSHLHFERQTDADDQLILDLLEAEDVRYGGVLCYNPTSTYEGRMSEQDIPQARLGMPSLKTRGDYQIISGQEYRSGHYGHTKVFLADELVQSGKTYDPNIRPVFADAVGPIRKQGGLVFWAHGGYGKEIYADYLLDAVDGVELLQFGIYRPIGLEGWYHILNTGHRLPAIGASDYPACRKLADCRTYVYADHAPRMDEWLRGLKAGRSFVTTGPLLLLDVDGKLPGDQIHLTEPRTLSATIRVRSEVAPVTHIDLVVNGSVRDRLRVTPAMGTGRWLTLITKLPVSEPSWIAATAYSFAKTGGPDAEAHTNPVHVDINGRRPWNNADAAWLLARLDERIATHRKRLENPDRDEVLRYFDRARQKLVDLQTDHEAHR